MKLLSKFMTLAAAVAVSVSLASCGGDDNEEPDIPSKPVVESVTAAYSAKLSDAYFEFYDVTVIYTDEDGKRVTRTVNSGGEFNSIIPAAKLPEKIQFAVQINAKNPTPSIDKSAKYIFEDDISLAVRVKYSDGTTGQYNDQGAPGTMTIGGDNLAAYLAKYQEELFGPFEYSTASLTNK